LFQEEELRQAADPKYAHLNDDLHVEISAIGPPSECYARIAFALAEVRKYLIPDSNDTIRQEQLREIMAGEAGEAAIAKIKQKAQYKYKRLTRCLKNHFKLISFKKPRYI
jgi:hypothetical protein